MIRDDYGEKKVLEREKGGWRLVIVSIGVFKYSNVL